MALHNFKKTIEIPLDALATDAEATKPFAVAPFDFTLVSAEVIPAAAITGANTNNRKFEVINKGAAGAGSTVMASLEFASGVNGAAFDAKALTNSAVDGALEGDAGDVLALASTAPGTGIADPGGLLRVVIARRGE